MDNLIKQMHERDLAAHHAIRKAFEATRDYAKASVEEQSRDLQTFIIRIAEKAARGDERL